MKAHTYLLVLPLIFMSFACSSSRTSAEREQGTVPEPVVSADKGQGQTIQLRFEKGPAHNHPLMAVWVEDLEGRYIQSLFVARSIATGVFAYGTNDAGKWAPGERRRPAALPYWGHKRGIKAADGYYVPDAGTAVPDAYSGATPKSSFILTSKLDQPATAPFRVLIEINQSWDWNKHWTNTRYPEDAEYKTSSQPAVVYAAVLDPANKGAKVSMQAIGRSHHAGRDGGLYDDLHTLTTALQIARSLEVSILP